MKVKQYLLKFNFVQAYSADKILDKECEKYIVKADHIKGRFAKKLYLQIISCAKTDAYDFYVSLLNPKSHILNGYEKRGLNALHEIYKWAAFYNVIAFLHDKPADVDRNEIISCFDVIFSLDKFEKAAFIRFEEMSRDSKQLFEIAYTKEFAKKLFESENFTAIILAFVSNFFYNSYEGFIKSFTYYVPLESRSLVAGGVRFTR